MVLQITASSKGQVVLPKRVRERLGIASGTRLDVIDTPSGVELRPARVCEPVEIEAAIRRLQTIVDYHGPRLDEEEWQRGIAAAIQEKWGKPGG